MTGEPQQAEVKRDCPLCSGKSRGWLPPNQYAAYLAHRTEPFQFPTESPIERKLIWEFLELCPDWCVPDVHEDQRRFLFVLDGKVFRLEAQAPVGPYRVDFLIEWMADELRIVIECDGFDFHERTREQAERDRRRDRELQARGYHVLRFMGSEIHRGCAGELRDVLSRLAEAG